MSAVRRRVSGCRKGESRSPGSLLVNEAVGAWTNLGLHETGEGLPHPRAIVETWLRERGIDPTLLGDEEIRIDHLCGGDSHGQWSQEYRIMIRSAALYRLGLRPEQE